MKNNTHEPIKSKRSFLKFVLAACGVLAFFTFIKLPEIVELINRARNRFQSPSSIPDASQRSEAQLPVSGTKVSVEMALNSRCSSDFDDDSNLFHWGLFDKNNTLSNGQLVEIENYLHIPFFSEDQLKVKRDKNFFTFAVANAPSEPENDWGMVKSGMQQQAICLVCSALGVGMRFKGMGKDGRRLSDNTQELIGMKLDAMKPSYNGSFWTESSPVGLRSWSQGNLSDPVRNGTIPLISELSKLQVEKFGDNVADDRAISQLLWAARGRTPHRYKSREWGMTVPTALGSQDRTSVFYCFGGTIYKYLNWKSNRPTHHLEKTGLVDNYLLEFFDNLSPTHDSFIILSRSEDNHRALWEIGYEVLNILLQASAWDLRYKLILLDNEQKKYFSKTNITRPVAVVAVTGAISN